MGLEKSKIVKFAKDLISNNLKPIEKSTLDDIKENVSEKDTSSDEKEESDMLFIVTPDEKRAIRKWMEDHVREKHNGNSYSGAIGGRYTYQFTPTSIGDIGYIECSCGEQFCFKEL